MYITHDCQNDGLNKGVCHMDTAWHRNHKYLVVIQNLGKYNSWAVGVYTLTE